jgi:hypothetical protein
MLEKNKNYTFKELKDMENESIEVKNFLNQIESAKELKKKNKTEISKFEDFDQNTRSIYLSIAQEIKKINLDQDDLYVIASGSRVNGKWKTEQESESIAKKYNLNKIKYSDYDFITNAKNIPNLIELAKKLEVRYINRIGSYNGREINIPLNIS